MHWLFIQLGTTSLTAFNNILDKKLIDRQGVHPLLCMGTFGFVGLPVIALGITGLVSWPALLDLVLPLVGGLCFVLAVVFYYQAVALDEVSRLVPLLRLSSLMVLLFSAFLFGERLQPTQYIAFATMLLGSVLLILKPGERSLTLSRGAGLMLSAAALLAVRSTLVAELYKRYSLGVAFVADQTGVTVGVATLLILAPGKRKLWQGIRMIDRSTQAMLVGEQMVRLITSFLSAHVLVRVGSAALVSAMGGISPFFVLLLARWLLGESIDRRNLFSKTVGVSCMSLGMVLLMV
jgi:drug/metabolite transporter (DMT)-like permease